MEPFTLERLGEAIGSSVGASWRQRVATGVSTDTREITPGDVFFALSGDRFDGGAFVPQALAKGAVACVVERSCPDYGPDQPQLYVDDVRAALGAFAADYRQRMNFRVVGITGSAGKTTTKDMIHAILGDHRVVCARKSFNNDVGVPLTLLRADRSTQVVVLEIGTNAPGEIEALGRIARPDVAVITCIGESHLEGLGSIEGVAREKLSLLRHVPRGGSIVLNGDDLRLRGAASAVLEARGADAITLCGFGDDLDWRGRVLEKGRRWRVGTSRDGLTGPTLDLPIPGLHSALDALLAIAACEQLGVDPARAARALQAFAAPPGRLNVGYAGGVTLIDDTYNANPTSVVASLEAFASMAPPSQRVVVLGTMHELGTTSARRHASVGRWVARMGVAGLVCVGEGAIPLAEGAVRAGLSAERVLQVMDAGQVAEAVQPWLSPGVQVFFKASRACRLERAVDDIRNRLEGRRAIAA